MVLRIRATLHAREGADGSHPFSASAVDIVSAEDAAMAEVRLVMGAWSSTYCPSHALPPWSFWHSSGAPDLPAPAVAGCGWVLRCMWSPPVQRAAGMILLPSLPLPPPTPCCIPLSVSFSACVRDKKVCKQLLAALQTGHPGGDVGGLITSVVKVSDLTRAVSFAHQAAQVSGCGGEA